MANLRTVKKDAIFSKSQKSRKHSFDIKLPKKKIVLRTYGLMNESLKICSQPCETNAPF